MAAYARLMSYKNYKRANLDTLSRALTSEDGPKHNINDDFYS